MYRFAIKECIKAGMTDHEAAKTLGMSSHTYGTYKRINGLSKKGLAGARAEGKPKFSRVVVRNAERDRPAMEGYIERGLSISQIAVETGRNRETISNYMEILGLTPKPAGPRGKRLNRPKTKPKAGLVSRILKSIFGRFINE